VEREQLKKDDQWRVSNGIHYMKKTTAGWDLELEQADSTNSWLPLRELKETNMVKENQPQ
jgi:hypothetical protein